MDYKNAGVDIEAGYESVELMKKYVKGTMRPEVLGGLGGFSGAFSMEAIKGMEEPVLLSGTDGCGTKVKLAFLLDKHDTIGIDCVAMCVNDVACAGGEPLFFLDYIACGKNYPEKIATIVSGVAEGCKQSGCALIGGETAEHPGLMPEDEYDLAGFTVGVVDKKDIITGENLKAGDVLIGMASTGVHSNGFSLVRKIFKMDKETLNTYHEELGKTLGEALLAPTRIYVKALKNVKEAGVRVKACSHITGGGFYENVLGFLMRNIYLHKDRNNDIFLLCLNIDLLCQTVGINRMDQCNLSDNVFYFVSLQMSDHMPFDILWHFLDFIAELLHFIFAEIPDIFIINFLKHLNWFCFTDSDQRHFFSLSSCAVTRFLYTFFYIF